MSSSLRLLAGRVAVAASMGRAAAARPAAAMAVVSVECIHVCMYVGMGGLYTQRWDSSGLHPHVGESIVRPMDRSIWRTRRVCD